MNKLSIHLYPSTMVGESRLLRMSRSLQSSGLFSETHLVGKRFRDLPPVDELVPGVFIVRLPGRGRIQSGVIGKVLSTLRWYTSCLKAYSKRPCGAVSAHSVWVLPLGWLLSKRTSAPLFYNPHEYESGTPTMVGPVRLMARLIEKVIVPRCSGFSCVNSSISDEYANDFPKVARPVVVRNFPSLLDRTRGYNLRELCAVPEGSVLFVHSGNLVSGRNIELLLSIFSSEETESHIVFLGAGPLARLVDEAAYRCERIHRVDPVGPTEVVATVATADVALCVIDTQSRSYRLSSPNKLFEGLSAGLPVLCSDLPEARRIYGDLSRTWVVTDLGESLLRAVQEVDASRISEFKRRLPTVGNWEAEVAELVAKYREVLGD